MGSVSNPVASTVSAAASVNSVSLPATNSVSDYFPSIINNALVWLKEDGITGTSAVTEWTNSGTGGANYDLDVVVGTGANLKPHPSGSCLLYGASGDYASTPDSAAASITGDIEIIARINPDDNTPSATKTILAKRKATGHRAYFLNLNTNGTLALFTSPDGLQANQVSGTSTVTNGQTDGTPWWVRVTLDVDDGSGNRVYNFYTSSEQVTDPSRS